MADDVGRESEVSPPTDVASLNEPNQTRVYVAPPARERSKESVFWIETEKIVPNPEQPRAVFDEEGLKQMAESIRQYGILQPIVVSRIEREIPTGTRVEYQLIAGERRYRAARMLGLAHMPAVIRREEMTARTHLELAIIENVQREDLNAMEKARAFKRLTQEFHVSQTDIASRIGKSRVSVTNTMRLLGLPERMQEAVLKGIISEGHARALLAAEPDSPEQNSLFERIVAEHLTVRDVEAAAREVSAEQRMKKVEQVLEIDPAVRMLEADLANVLGTRVRIRRGREGKGHISIEFFSEDEFKTLTEKIAQLKAGVSNFPVAVPKAQVDEASAPQPEDPPFTV